MKRYFNIILCIIVLSVILLVLPSCTNNNEATIDNAATVDQATEKPLPWEIGGKQPIEYTAEEFKALSPVEQEAFAESFESVKAFEEWEKKSGYDGSQQVELPWENGGKKPSEYTFEEFEALSGPLQEAFAESFDTVEDFENWEAEASKK